MRKKRTSLLALLCAGAVLLSGTGVASADVEPGYVDQFSDLALSHYAYDEMKDLLWQKTISGFSTSEIGHVEVRADHPTTRAEFVTMLVLAMGLTSDAGGKKFTDVSPTDWYYNSVRIATAKGIVSGVSTTRFAPNDPIERGEMATLLVKAFAPTVAATGAARSYPDIASYWGKANIDTVTRMGLMSGDETGKFLPAAPASRAQAATVLYNALHAEKTGLSADQEIVSVASSYYSQYMELINTGQLSGLNAIHSTYTSGRFRDKWDGTTQYLLGWQAKGYNVSIAQYGTEPTTFTLINKTYRLAQIRVTRGTSVIRWSHPETGHEGADFRMLSGLLYLKRSPGVSPWKIYRIDITP
ncbi:hypothetical protein CBW65_10715 [Tumebacillus avium]|uniref:SLH domain-containing protein n=1 Tax=Tumebacillus avium TaxID=1903704 RepID=A0A1Y0ILN0_9BACL|nr:S-layer homology domain-containing protein [Tumebacillus avium]ARU61422.1 hypothetical protein CBW65_10715 [Tumebacillus avium]